MDKNEIQEIRRLTKSFMEDCLIDAEDLLMDRKFKPTQLGTVRLAIELYRSRHQEITNTAAYQILGQRK